MSIIYLDFIDEYSAWHIPVCRVMNLDGAPSAMSMNVVDIYQAGYIKRAAH